MMRKKQARKKQQGQWDPEKARDVPGRMFFFHAEWGALKMLFEQLGTQSGNSGMRDNEKPTLCKSR